MPEWDELALTWEDLRVLPTRWKSALSQWRGVYVIFDHDDGKRYVGSAYGKDNLLGRWLHYAAALLHEYPLRVGRRGPHFSGPSAGVTLQG